MKYLQITKSIWKSGEYSWHLNTENLSIAGLGKHRFKLAEKLFEAGTATMNKICYEVHETSFKANGKKVYIVCINDEHKPSYLMYYGYDDNKRCSRWQIDSGCIIDEDIELFESYGYTEKL